MEYLKYINEFSSLILVIATIVYVFFTIRLSQETTKLREVETSPFLSLTLEPLDSTTTLKLVIKNIGKAPAYKIQFSIDSKFEQIFRYNFKNKISYFAPNQEIIIIGKQYSDFEKLDDINIPISIDYYSKEENIFNETFYLEWQFLEGTILETDSVKKIDKNLKDISLELKKLTTTIKEKEYEVTNKLKILEIEKTEMYLKFIFSNGYLDKVRIKDIHKLSFQDINKIRLSKGKLLDGDKNLIYTAEEIYYKLLNLKK